ncbi:hypothetical protein NDU88_003757 [Pleurodeles waltl]|uniref:Uncharacterized protein n=1 Tax=Pleurodeles waltl TaxID=8319 RepID=A0AAV7VEA4_PLEWA|nr:hypothetical protein NDU88_003757 [Pleurodeles waltl]
MRPFLPAVPTPGKWKEKRTREGQRNEHIECAFVLLHWPCERLESSSCDGSRLDIPNASDSCRIPWRSVIPIAKRLFEALECWFYINTGHGF